MTKRKNSSKRKKRDTKKSSIMAITLIGLIAILIIALFTGIAGWMGYEAGKESVVKSYEKRVQQYEEDLKRLREKLDENRLDENRFDEGFKEEALEEKKEKKDENTFDPLELSEINDYKEASKESKTQAEETKKIIKNKKNIDTKGKLVIIIDDIETTHHIDAIKSLPWKITPSIFPPYVKHKNTPNLAKSVEHYIIHLPMEAIKHRFHEKETLSTSDTQQKIDDKIRYIKENFPDAKFINNHTGSKFTSDQLAVDKLFNALQKYGFEFIDSRTTPKTVVPMICKKYKKPYIARDVFIDNKLDVNYIKNQIKKAIKIAKSHGYAIAIGHPRAVTFKAIAESKDILSSVDVVYVDELYEELAVD